MVVNAPLAIFSISFSTCWSMSDTLKKFRNYDTRFRNKWVKKLTLNFFSHFSATVRVTCVVCNLCAFQCFLFSPGRNEEGEEKGRKYTCPKRLLKGRGTLLRLMHFTVFQFLNDTITQTESHVNLQHARLTM